MSSTNTTISDLSTITGIGRTTLSHLNNSSQMPEKTKLGTLLEICKALNISFSELIETQEFNHTFSSFIPLHSGSSIGFSVIHSSGETSNFFSLIVTKIKKDIPFKNRRNLDNDLGKLDSKYDDMLRDKGEDISVDTDEDYKRYMEMFQTKYPELLSEKEREQQEITDYYFNKYPQGIAQIEFQPLEEFEWDYIKSNDKILSTEINQFSPIRFNAFSEFITNQQLMNLTLSIEKRLSHNDPSQLLSPRYTWRLYDEKYEMERFKVFSRTRNNPKLQDIRASIASEPSLKSAQEHSIIIQLLRNVYNN